MIRPELVQASLLPLPKATGAYEVWRGLILPPPMYLRRVRGVYGLGDTPGTDGCGCGSVGQEEDAAIAEAQRAWLRRLIWGGAFGAVAGFAASEFLLGKAGETAQIKAERNKQLVTYGALFGGAVGLFTTV